MGGGGAGDAEGFAGLEGDIVGDEAGSGAEGGDEFSAEGGV